MNKSMGDMDGVEVFRRRLTYDKIVVYNAIVARCFNLLAGVGNQGKSDAAGVALCSMSQ